MKELSDCIEKWEDSRNELKSTPSPDFPEFVYPLRRSLLSALRTARSSQQREEFNRTKNSIEALLRDKKEEYEIDDCVRWQILFKTVVKASSPSQPGSDALGGEEDDEKNDDLTLSKIVIGMAPYLAFENPIQGSALREGRSITGDCRYKGMHLGQKRSSTPFLEAARAGNAAVIRHMIREAKRSRGSGDSSSLPRVLSQRDPESNSTVLKQATRAPKNGRAQTLKVLLEEAPGIFLPSDGTFEGAIDEGLVEVVNTFLLDERLREEFVSSKNIIRALDKIPEGGTLDNESPQARILRSLLKHVKDAQGSGDAQNSKRPRRADAFDHEVVEAIIKRNLEHVWKHEDLPNIEPETSNSLLHLAVIHQKLNFVKIFIKADPASVTRKAPPPKSDRSKRADGTKEYYALWHNNHVWNEQEKTEKKRKGLQGIRTEIVEETIRQVSRMQTLSSIFQESGEQVGELSFDISRFDSKLYKVSDFVQSLINHHENEDLLSYEPTIRYAEFPALDLSPEERKTYGDNAYLPSEPNEVVRALDWLEKNKRVKRIIELKVPDRMINPHNELVIAEYVRKFEVEVLDWRFLDMSLSVFNDEVKGRIRELHLYSSGRWAAVRHWLSREGVQNLPKLSSLYIYVVKEMMTEEACIKFANEVRAEFWNLWQNHWPHKDATTGEPVLGKPKVLRIFWNPTQQKLPDLGVIAQRVVPTLSRFIQGYRKLAEMRLADDERRFQQEEAERKKRGEPERRKEDDPRYFRPVKVAIIDNGIMSISPQPTERAMGAVADPQGTKGNTANGHAHLTALRHAAQQEDQERGDGGRTLWSRIERGQSFVDDESKVSPWLFASHPHGTQMANLICAIDPMCQLYVAKVADGKYGTTALRVQKAIKWARDHKVDIISMSFTIAEMPNGLDKEIKGADDDGILMLCSTHDEGYNVADAYPADHKRTITIAACDEYGGLLRSLAESKYDFAFYGSNVPAGKIPFVESTERITGSSAATAIAAGLSSLLLSCERLAFPEGPPDPKTPRPEKVKDYLMKQMLSKALAPDKQGGVTKYVMLSKFGGIDSNLRDGEDTYTPGTEHIYADKILDKHFRDYFKSAAKKTG